MMSFIVSSDSLTIQSWKLRDKIVAREISVKLSDKS